MSNKPTTDPIPGLAFDGTAEILYSPLLDDLVLIQHSGFTHWADWPKNVKDLLSADLDKDLVAQSTVDHIESSDQKLYEFTKCRYGALNKTPDIIDGELVDDQEYFDCGLRGECPWEGKRCNQIKGENGYLGAREITIIKEIAKDLTNDQIAKKLFISPHTVKTHIDNIRFKLATNSKAGIVAFAYKKQLINS